MRKIPENKPFGAYLYLSGESEAMKEPTETPERERKARTVRGYHIK
ncbi:MAG: hypothetical protein WB014_13700 [Methanosarcina sp.]